LIVFTSVIFVQTLKILNRYEQHVQRVTRFKLFTNTGDVCRHSSLPDTGLQAHQVIGVDTIVELIPSVTDVSDGGADISGVDR
jgi:hypothetical protein